MKLSFRWFGPDDPVTVGQAVTVVLRLLGYTAEEIDYCVKLADAVLGLTAVGAVKLFTMLVFPNTILFALLEYCLTGFVVSFICPYCFHRINHKLSPRRPNKTARLP